MGDGGGNNATAPPNNVVPQRIQICLFEKLWGFKAHQFTLDLLGLRPCQASGTFYMNPSNAFSVEGGGHTTLDAAQQYGHHNSPVKMPATCANTISLAMTLKRRPKTSWTHLS